MNALFKTGLCLMLALVAVRATPAVAGDLDDETIFAIFDQANMADIATGRLGWKKGESEEVRALAKMVVTDHSAVQRMGRDVAAKMGVLGTPPDGDGSWAAQAAALEKLDKLSGREFDEAYLRYEIAYHTAVIEAIETTLLPAIEDADFKALVEKVLPGFKHHLAATRQAADAMGVGY
ncbi:DUF4142 domain-containing protein [Rhodobium gokarnense]|uniref:Membrane protein n=1 Tax=Rhodobium gokarnense TaxID=364296 RepID=A0ABT3H9D8_9HYPH|nr:DUF4142 domain-containing protein [Rhodobium gokarnense]MCW2307015.1 putative membrane protein [Rhodobium gokarnense]